MLPRDALEGSARQDLAQVSLAARRSTPCVALRCIGGWTAGRRPMCRQRRLPVSEDLLLRWRLMVVEQGRQAGHCCSQPDLFIAATALHQGKTRVTRHRPDFVPTRVALPDPWNGPDGR
jgi:hypothetical protein